jgi:hypothetical protein
MEAWTGEKPWRRSDMKIESIFEVIANLAVIAVVVVVAVM